MPRPTWSEERPVVVTGSPPPVLSEIDQPPGPVGQEQPDRVREVVVLSTSGPLPDVVDDLHRAVLYAWADDPRGVVCDLTRVADDHDSDGLARLATLGEHVRDWPAAPLAVVCADLTMRHRLRAQPMSQHLLAGRTVSECCTRLDRRTPATKSRIQLSAAPGASRAAREFVSRTCLEWGLRDGVASACLVVSEFVTNVVQHAVTEMDVSIARHGRRLRVAVRDGSPRRPVPLPDDVGRLHGRGLVLVDAFSRSWGTLPSSDGGKVAWAVVDV